MAEGNLHVWRSSIETAPRHALGIFDHSERERLERIHFPAARASFIARRYLLRTVLGRYLGVDPASILFAYAPGGKPGIQNPNCRLAFNLSHSHGLALLAVGQQALGVDVEHLRPIAGCLGIARRVLSAVDIEQLERADEPARSMGFLECWTRFEAHHKALGRGVFAAPATELASSLTFRPDVNYIGCVAWLARDPAPKVSWFSADI